MHDNYFEQCIRWDRVAEFTFVMRHVTAMSITLAAITILMPVDQVPFSSFGARIISSGQASLQ